MHNQTLSHIEKKIFKKLRKKCSNVEIVVIKQSTKAICLGNSRPCIICLNMMKLLNFKNVYYSNSDGDMISEKVSDMQSTHKSQMTRSNLL